MHAGNDEKSIIRQRYRLYKSSVNNYLANLCIA